MPRAARKRAWLDPRKAPLLFAEAPLNGAKHHHYVAERLRSFGTKPLGSETRRQNHSASSTWVTPQFDTTMELQTSVRRRGRGKVSHSGRSALDRSSLLTSSHLKKTTACKAPALCFESSTSSSPTQYHTLTHSFKAPQMPRGAPEPERVLGCVHKTVYPSTRSGGHTETPQPLNTFRRSCKRGMAAHGELSPEASTTAVPREQRALSAVTGERNVSSVYTTTPPALRSDHFHSMDSVFTPPSVETPDTQRSRTISKSPPSFTVQSPLTQRSVTPKNQTSYILVNDTPEEEYGMKVTWRRRKRLMKFLLEQGQLSYSDISN